MSSQVKQDLEKFLFTYLILPLTSGANMGVFNGGIEGGPFLIGDYLITDAWTLNPYTNNRPNGERMRNFQRDRLRLKNSNVKLVVIKLNHSIAGSRTIPLFVIDGNSHRLWINPMAALTRNAHFKYFYNILTDQLVSNFRGVKIKEAGEGTEGYDWIINIMDAGENQTILYRYRDPLGGY